MAEMLERPAKPYWDGVSYAGALTGGREDRGREDLVLSQCCHVCQRSVRWDDYLYIRTYHDGYHLFPEEQLFNLAEDPYEERDLAVERPDLCREAAWRLMNWHDQMMAGMPAGRTTDPMREVLAEGGPFHARGCLPKYIKRLEASGRGATVDQLRRRHPSEFKS